MIVSSTLVRQVVFSESVEVRRVQEHPETTRRARKLGGARLPRGASAPALMPTEEHPGEVQGRLDPSTQEQVVAAMRSALMVGATAEPRTDMSSDVDRAFAADRGHHHGGQGCFYCARSVSAYEVQSDILEDYLGV